MLTFQNKNNNMHRDLLAPIMISVSRQTLKNINTGMYNEQIVPINGLPKSQK